MIVFDEEKPPALPPPPVDTYTTMGLPSISLLTLQELNAGSERFGNTGEEDGEDGLVTPSILTPGP